MGERDVDRPEPDLLGSPEAAPVEVDERLAAGVGEDLDVLPGDRPGARPERLHDRLLGREAGRQLWHPATAEGGLGRREDAADEALGVAAQHALHPLDLDHVDADGVSGHAPKLSTPRWHTLPVTAQIIQGNQIAATVRREVATGVAELVARGQRPPHLTAVLVGDDAASATYVRLKSRDCAEVGMTSQVVRMGEETSEAELLSVVSQLNRDDGVDGVIVQKPLPARIDEGLVDARLSAVKDVDGLGPTSLGLLVQGRPAFVPATPAGILELLARSGIDPEGQEVVVIGRSTLVGRPLALLLSAKAPGANATVTIAHTGTRDLAAVTRRADILVAAAGRRGLITGEMVRPGAVVVDVGTNRVPDPSKRSGFRLAGDVHFETVREVAGSITPVPGGVGPMTRAMLLVNTLAAARRRTGHVA